MHPLDLSPPSRLLTLARAVDDAGGRAFVVGGSVRDHLIGLPIKDWDVEVFGLSPKALEKLLRRLGRVNTVGRAFGVFKLTVDGREVDVSVPRRDSKAGPGHKGISVEGDPDMSVDEAVRRRDLTVNAMMVDLLTGELVDPAGGRADLEQRVLRAVDPEAFLEDPLRAVRVVQFAARLESRVDPDLLDLCTDAALDELPPERIQGEWLKLLLRAPNPSTGLAVAREASILARVFPTLVDDPDLDAAVDRAVDVSRSLTPEARRLGVRLLVWTARTPGAALPGVLDALGLFRMGGYPLRDALLAAHPYLDAAPGSDAALRRLSTHCELLLLFTAQQALHPGDGPSERLAASARLGILTAPPDPLLRGRDLLTLGVRPGPGMGAVLKQVYDAQLDGTVESREQATRMAQDLLALP